MGRTSHRRFRCVHRERLVTSGRKLGWCHHLHVPFSLISSRLEPLPLLNLQMTVVHVKFVFSSPNYSSLNFISLLIYQLLQVVDEHMELTFPVVNFSLDYGINWLGGIRCELWWWVSKTSFPSNWLKHPINNILYLVLGEPIKKTCTHSTFVTFPFGDQFLQFI